MIRSDLIARIAKQNPHLYAHEAEAVVNVVLGRIAAALADSDRVELRDFGMFAVRDRKARTGRNPRSGQSVTVSAKRSVHFKPGKAMRTRLNPGRIELGEETERLLRAS
ncbi:integration host factor subunit beta [Methylobacterium phyllostachyos]|uniref:Integration host factor subunit beta n=1 Tax=Methylobacterium phyllostachyos TaxID=582672 RepID=A0A1H0KWP3_9HYPH|nr:HU family DNA-binding protein [Methylobacterium phyllostachyos]SDO60216.1 integration host factor subunit beta [Methylobacterium phyllostachyos]